MLTGTPYLLEGEQAPGVMSGAEELMKEVHDLRMGGTLDDKTVETLRDEWKIEQVYEATGIEGNQSGSRRDTNGDHAAETRMASREGSRSLASRGKIEQRRTTGGAR